jgi:hypothetical protein
MLACETNAHWHAAVAQHLIAVHQHLIAVHSARGVVAARLTVEDAERQLGDAEFIVEHLADASAYGGSSRFVGE